MVLAPFPIQAVRRLPIALIPTGHARLGRREPLTAAERRPVLISRLCVTAGSWSVSYPDHSHGWYAVNGVQLCARVDGIHRNGGVGIGHREETPDRDKSSQRVEFPGEAPFAEMGRKKGKEK